MKKTWKALCFCAVLVICGLFLLTSLTVQGTGSFRWNALQRSKRSASVHDNNTSQNTTHGNAAGHAPTRYQVANVNWNRVANPFIISLWIIFAGLAKLAFHLPVLHKVVSRVPESCLLICMGLIVGGIAYSIDPQHRIEQLLFNPDTFFLFILPPIVMEAGYFMPKEPFFANLGTILTYAIIGTVFNALAIGGSLYAVYIGGLMPGIDSYGTLTILHCLLFGSIISAVDPVAVISVFEEIHVNTVLYICVFGESLLNDGVAVVLFKMFEGYIHIGETNIIGIDIVAAIASFFVVAFGGLFIGIFFGYCGAFITKYTVNNRIIEPTFVFVVCYMAYLSAEVFHLSGILAIVFAAFTMSAYVEHNISSKSHTTVKYGMKMLANIAETIIFMLLGIASVSDFWQYWNTGFVLWTLLFITMYRAIGVVGLTFVVNYIRLDKISKVDQFVMAYGGLRGAIAFSLVSLTSPELVPPIKTMICACIVAILFTSFVQGSTIRPIVEFLHVKKADQHKKTMFEDVNFRLVEHVMAGIEDVIGYHGHHYWMQRLLKFNADYFSKWFVRAPYKCRDLEILETFHRLTKREAVEAVEELERSGSSPDVKIGGTFGSFLLPLDIRRSYSHTSFNSLVRDQGQSEAIIDMHAFAVHNGAKESVRNLEDTDVHHLLQRNMYKPRVRETTRHRRGQIDDDSNRQMQEREILMRHRIHQKQRQRHRHSKSKHTRHKHRSSSKNSFTCVAPSPKGYHSAVFKNSQVDERSHLLMDPPYIVEQVDEEEKAMNSNADEGGIVFAAGKDKACLKNEWKLKRNPLGFMSSIETLTEEPEPDEKTNDTVGPADDAVAIDRELPWKACSSAAVCDPHSADHRQGTRVQFELWPQKDDAEKMTPEAASSNEQRETTALDEKKETTENAQQATVIVEVTPPDAIDNEQWIAMEEDCV